MLAWQQFGRGKAVALHARRTRGSGRCTPVIPLEDQTHENFWRQMLRWLVDGVPGVVDARTTTERVEPGEAVTIEATVVDKTFVELNDATVDGPRDPARRRRRSTCRCSGPASATASIAARSSAARPAPTRWRWTRSRGGKTRRQRRHATCAPAPGDAEFFDPTMHAGAAAADCRGDRRPLLHAGDAAGLAEDVRYAGRGVTSVEERELWNMPIILIALMGLVCAEWGYRRAVGLA